MKNRRFIVGVLALEAVALAAALLIVLDMSLHRRVEKQTGVNVWGYRGPVVKRKPPGETRIVLLGGTAAFGEDVVWDDSLSFRLEQFLNTPILRRAAGHTGRGPISVINLAAPRENVSSFVHTLRHYEYLDYDIVCLYGAPRDLTPKGGGRPEGWRRESLVFRKTGYLPILPLALRLDKVVTGSLSTWLPGDLDGAVISSPGQVTDSGCAAALSTSCRAIEAAVNHALAREKRVVVALQPGLSGEHAEPQRAVAAMLHRRFGTDPRFRYVDLGRSVNLRDESLTLDEDHLTGPGSKRVAEALSQSLFDFLNGRP